MKTLSSTRFLAFSTSPSSIGTTQVYVTKTPNSPFETLISFHQLLLISIISPIFKN